MKTKKPRANSKPNNSQTNPKPKNPRKKTKNPKTKNPPSKNPPTKTKKSAKKGQVKTTKKSKAIKKSIEKDPPQPQKTKKEEIIILPSKFPKRPKKPVPIKKHMTRRSFLDNVNALEGASPQVSPEVRPAESKLDLFLERLT